MEDIEEPSPNSEELRKSKLKTFMAWANASKGLIASITAFLTAMAAILKPQDHTATKNSYEILARGILEVQKSQQKNHEDILALRSYLDGFTHTQPPSVQTDEHPVTAVRKPIRISVSAAPQPLAKPLPPPPIPTPAASPWKAPNFDQVIK